MGRPLESTTSLTSPSQSSQDTSAIRTFSHTAASVTLPADFCDICLVEFVDTSGRLRVRRLEEGGVIFRCSITREHGFLKVHRPGTGPTYSPARTIWAQVDNYSRPHHITGVWGNNWNQEGDRIRRRLRLPRCLNPSLHTRLQDP